MRNKEKATTDTTALNNVLYTNSLRERYDDMSCYVQKWQSSNGPRDQLTSGVTRAAKIFV